MTDIFSKMDRAKELAAQHAKYAKAAAAATKKRDTRLFRFLDVVHEIERELRLMGKKQAGQVLQAKYGKPWPKNPNDFLKLIYPGLPPKRRSRYIILLRHVRARKNLGTPLRKFVRQEGGINLTKAK
jgi:hypothetical protein